MDSGMPPPLEPIVVMPVWSWQTVRMEHYPSGGGIYFKLMHFKCYSVPGDWIHYDTKAGYGNKSCFTNLTFPMILFMKSVLLPACFRFSGNRCLGSRGEETLGDIIKVPLSCYHFGLLMGVDKQQEESSYFCCQLISSSEQRRGKKKIHLPWGDPRGLPGISSSSFNCKWASTTLTGQ